MARGISIIRLLTGTTSKAEVEINKRFKKPDVPYFVKRFEREEREVYAGREKIVAACGLKPGMAVADVGAGTGLFTRLFAEKVGEKGRVFAVDISPEFLKRIKKISKAQGLTNVETVHCDQKSAKLPCDSVDLVFICDTYHHFEFPYKTMRSIHTGSVT